MDLTENERLMYYCGNIFDKHIHIDNALLQQCVNDTTTININNISLIELNNQSNENRCDRNIYI